MRMVRHLLHTFDYELFLGPRSGSPQDCVLESTEKIVEVLDAFNQKGIFFVDTLWLVRLNEVRSQHASAAKDWEAIATQLKTLFKSGHYVFPHLHPHWLEAKYLPELNQWDLSDLTYYTFAACSQERQALCFDQSVEVLRMILGEAWKPLGYRAGGWSIQPFEHFKPCFEKHGTKYDFSVLPGFWTDFGPQSFDFSRSRADRPYAFANDPLVEVTNGAFVEFPISVIPGNKEDFIQKTWRRIMYRTGAGKSSGKGIGVLVWPNPTYPQAASLNESHEMAAIELMALPILKRYLRLLEHNKFMQFISHPKMVSPHNLSTLRRFLRKASKKYQLESDFLKMLPHVQS
jgi:peptidoglycan/xylan/chitin deacetylase (PgdA/CDA1 family)